MGITKRDIYDEEINQFSDILKAIAHPARIQILREIAIQKDCVCNDLSASLNLAQSTISQHLKILRDHQIIKGSISKSSMNYCINHETLKLVAQMWDGFIELMKQSPKKENCN